MQICCSVSAADAYCSACLAPCRVRLLVPWACALVPQVSTALTGMHVLATGKSSRP